MGHVVLAAAVFGATAQAQLNAPRMATVGQTLTGQLLSGEVATFAFEATQGSAYIIAVDQNGLDFRIGLQPTGGALQTFNSPLRRDEPEYIFLDARTDSKFEITISPHEEFTDAIGEYTLKIDALNRSVADSRTVSAWQLMSDAASAHSSGPGDAATSVQLYLQAAELWHEVGDIRKQAQSLFSVAMLEYWLLEDYVDAAETAATAEQLYNGLGIGRLVAKVLLLQAYALAEVAGNAEVTFEDVFDYYDQSQAILDETVDRFELAHVIGWRALAHYYRGDAGLNDIERARDGFDHAQRLFSEIGEWREALNARQNRALIYFDEGRSDLAAAEFEEILRAIRSGEAEYFRGVVLSNLGYAYWNAGNYDAALQSFSQALDIHRRLRKFDWEADALMGLGKTYLALGDLEGAKVYLAESQEAFKHDNRVWVSILGNLGDIEYAQGNFSEALQHHQASVDASISKVDKAYRQSFVARDLLALGQYIDAIANAEDISSTPDVWAVLDADAALIKGKANLALGRIESASMHFESAQNTYRELVLQALQAEALHGRAQVAAAAGNPGQAIKLGNESLERIESIRSNVSAPLLRAQFSAQSQSYYKSQIELLMSEYQARTDASFRAAALSVSERSRGRLTADLIAESSLRLDDRLSAADRAQREELYDELRRLHRRGEDLGQRNAGNIEQAELDDIEAARLSIQTRLDLIETELRRTDPLGAELSVPKPLDARGIQDALDPDVTLLQYSLGEPKSYAWIVTAETIDAVELESRSVIETAARDAHNALSVAGPSRTQSPDLGALEVLATLVLAPVRDFLQPERPLLVAADGALHYVPFGVLPIPQDDQGSSLIDTTTVTHIPSVSVLAALRERSDTSTAKKTLLVFADPVFEESDPRRGDRKSMIVASSRETDNFLTRSSLGEPLVRLPLSALEAETIAALIPTDQALIESGFDVNRSSVLHRNLAEYRIVHFATHGRVDPMYPTLSGLAMSSRFDQPGNPTPEYLRLEDIYALKLNSDLIVLSACDTGLGTEIRGEGLVGFVQGFLYAGSKNVVVSLWQVPDTATARLMGVFYRHLIEDGLPPAESLRRAQLAISSDPRWKHPYFWGAFVIVGAG